MAYQNRFVSVDLLIQGLVPLASQPGLDPLVLSSMAGIVAVEAVTAYELAIKDIFEEFSRRKHNVFGRFVKATYDKLNGRIKYQEIKDNMVKSYGDRYLQKFVQKMETRTRIIFTSERVDLVQTYDSLVLGRHKFVHSGVLTLTLSEAIRYYTIGKHLIEVLDDTMKR